MNREAAYTALFEWVKARTTAYRVTSRRLVHWTELAQADTPALYMTQGAQQPTQPKGQPYIWRLTGSFYIYTNNNNVDVPPSSLQNALLDELEAALKPDNLQRQQLGTTFIDHFRFEGEIETDEGLLGDVTVAIVPFVMIVT